jgi:hypothetical protein
MSQELTLFIGMFTTVLAIIDPLGNSAGLLEGSASGYETKHR